MTSRTAERYQILTQVFGDKIDTVSNLGLMKGHLLAAPSTPVSIRTHVLECLMAGGDVPSMREIRAMISAAKAEQKRLEAEPLHRGSAIGINKDSEQLAAEPPIVDGGASSAALAEDDAVERHASVHASDVENGGSTDLPAGGPREMGRAAVGRALSPEPVGDTVEAGDSSDQTSGVNRDRSAANQVPAPLAGDDANAVRPPNSELAQPADDSSHATGEEGHATTDARAGSRDDDNRHEGGLFPVGTLPIAVRPKTTRDTAVEISIAFIEAYIDGFNRSCWSSIRNMTRHLAEIAPKKLTATCPTKIGENVDDTLTLFTLYSEAMRMKVTIKFEDDTWQ